MFHTRQFLARLSSRLFASCVMLAASVGGAVSPAFSQGVVAGQNVNMVGGAWSYDPATGRIVGDPFLQRQNEPSLAVSSRNPCHLLGGANDYRAVDVPGLPGDAEVGDAWLGLFKSSDCGHTWSSTLLPGYPQDQSADGLASPLKGLAAAADATVRSGPGGMLYYSGIAFNRGDNNIGKVFVSRFIDRNNQEKGDPIRYAGAVAVDTGTSGQFLDKPWIAVDQPRGTDTCTVDGETVPAAPVYLVYTSFVGNTNNPRSKIMFSKSLDCGATWSNPSKLSERIALNQGTTVAVSPVDGSIFVAWREFADQSLDPNDPSTVHAILFARSTDGGKSFSKAQAIDAGLHPFDQGSTGVSFRTNAFPTMAVDGTGRIYVAWAGRGFAAAQPDPVSGDARIVMATSGDGGSTWTTPRMVVDDEGIPGHQIMPALSVAAGKLMLVYYDFRDDISQVFGRYVNEAEASAYAGLRHTAELRAAMADPGSRPVFTDYATIGDERPSTQVTGYLQGSYLRDGQRVVGQLQFNPPNLPMFAQGTLPFIGDYLDVAAQAFVLNDARQWVFNTDADPTGRRLPLFHASWSDNRDVRRPPAGQTWASYKSPTFGPTGEICDPGTNPGSRNQNIYTAPLMPGLVVTSPGNQKTLGRIQRAFVVYARNSTDQDRYYTLSVPAQPSGAWASFTRIDEQQLPDPAVTLQIGPITIPRRSSIARSVFIVSSGQAYPAVTVQVVEVAGSGQAPAVAAVTLNADLANPDIANPDIANPDIANPDIANAEVYNPDIANVTVDNPDIANPDIANPDIANPDIANPDIANTTIANPDIANPDIANPDIANPDIANPDIANPDIANTSPYDITDVTWSIQNKGNTTAAYAFKARLAKELPAGAKLQLIVRRVYVAPQANAANFCADPEPAIQNQVLVNIPNPDLNADLFAAFDPQAYQDNASFYLAPSDEGRVTLRLFCPKNAAGCPVSLNDALSLAAARIEAQAPNNCPAGSTEANCLVNGFQPDDIYDITAPSTTCTVNGADCADGPFYVTSAASVSLAPSDAVGVQETVCTLDGQACPAGLTFPVTGEGSHTITFQSRDYSGNLELLQTVVVNIDATAPVVSGFLGFPELGSWTNAPSVTGSVDVSDATSVSVTCDDSIGGTSVSGLSITVSGDGSHVVACTVTDQAGNSVEATTTVNLDTGDPTVAVPTVLVTAEAAGPAGSSVTFAITATDSLSGATVVCDPPSSSAFTIGDTQVTCTATDGAGNTATATFTVSVRDTTPPAMTVPGGISVEAAGAATAVTFAASAVDVVDGAITPDCLPASGSAFAIGTSTVTCTAADARGNTGTASFTVTVGDTTPPAVTVPDSFTVEALSASGAAVTFVTSAVDLVDEAIAPTCSPASGATFPLGTTTVTCSAADTRGNTGSASFIVTVGDSTPPAVTVPASFGVEAVNASGETVTFAASAVDLVDGAISATCAPVSGSTFGLGTTSVTCSATDTQGNAGTASFTVTVADSTAPAVTLIGSSSLSLEAGSAFVDPGATASDIVAGALPVTIGGTVNTGTPGTYTLTYSATDPSGNTGSATRTVTVVDTTPPAVTVSVTPTSIWSPTGKLVPVTVSGTVTERGSGLSLVSFAVADEYGLVQPSGPVTVGAGGAYSFTVELQASRLGSDKDGRAYTITVTAVDRAGLRGSSAVRLVAVDHNQSK